METAVLFDRDGRFHFAHGETFYWNLRELRLRLASMGETAQSQHLPDCLRVLGVDPAAAGPTGYAIIESEGRGCRVLHYGAFQATPKRQKSSAGAALQDVHSLLCELIERFKPQIMAVESVFSALNVRTALRLAEVRGVVLLAGEQKGVEVYSYSPREVKACVAGYGHADKRQMQMMVKAQLGMKAVPEPSDAADALAVALCHLQTVLLEKRFGVKKAQIMAKWKPAVQQRATAAGRPAIDRGYRVQPVR
jgi:crossover junction endodeoxyribonuclease RuvC